MLFVVGALGFHANAQKDVTNQYITNATLSSLDGWTNVNFNTPQMGNNTIGYATECYEGWGSVEKSEYSLTQTITLPAGNYTLVNYSFFREGEAYNTDATTSRAYLKAGDNQVLVKTLGSIPATGYANSQAEGANCFDSKMYRNTLDFTIAADNTEIEIGVRGTFNTEITKSWMILGMFELIDNGQAATMDSPFDVTGYITNPGFEYRGMTGWTLSEDGAFGTQSNVQGFKVGGYYAEKWQPSSSGALSARSMSQTLSGLPAGYYELTANLGGSGTYIDLNGKTVSWTTDGDYTAGYVLQSNEDLVITAGKTAEGTANWIHFDNFRLKFYGDIAAGLTTLCNRVTEYESILPSTYYTALQSDVASKSGPYTTADEYITAIANVNALYAKADIYPSIKDKIELYAAKAAALDAAGVAAYDVSAIQTKYNNGTYETVSEAENELVAAFNTAVRAQTTAGSDWTAVIANPSFESDFTGWTNSGMAVQTNTSFLLKDGNNYVEAWQPNGTKKVEQTITAMPAGVYQLSAACKARGVTSAKIYAQGINKAITIADSEDTYSVTFACDANTDVTIGFEGVGTGAGSSWLCVDNFTLKLVSAGLPDVTAVEGKMNADIATAQTDAVTAYQASKTVDNYNAAAAAIAAAEFSIAAYASAKSAIDAANALKDAHNYASADAITTFADAIKAQNAKYTDASLTTEEAAALGVTLGVAVTGWHAGANTPASNYLENGFGLNDFDADLHINTWSTEGETDGSNFKVPFYEYWVGSGTLAPKTWSGSVALENGKYTVSAWVRVQSPTPADATGITMDVNGGTAVDVTEGTQVGTSQLQLKTYEATGFVNDGKLKVNFNILDGNNISWLAFKNVKYTFNGKCIGGEAQALPTGNVEAGKWYYFDIPAAGDDATYRVSAPTISDVVYTQDGLVLISNETSVTETFPATGGAAFSDGLKLTAGRYYVKSNSAQEISCVRTYAVEVDPNIELGAFNLDNAYEPAGATVTINVEPESEDYQMTKLKVYETANEESVVDVNINQGKYTFVMPAAAVTVTGEFSEVYDPIGYTINYYTEEDPFTPVKSVKGENFIKQVVEADPLFIDEESGKKYVLADETLNDFTSMTLQKEEKANILNVFVVEVPTYNYSVTTDNGIVVAEGTKFEDEVAPVAWFRYVQDEEGNWFEIKSDTYTAELTAEDKDLVLETEESDITAFYEAESLTPSEGVSTIDGEEYSGAAAIQLGVGASVATAEKIAGGYTDINVYAVSTAADAAPKYSIAYSADGEEWQETEVITFDAAAEGEPQVATVERLYLPEDCYIRLTEASEGEAQNNIDYITFTAVPMYEIAVDEAIENGTVTVSPDLAAEGDVVTLKATPAEGYALESYSVTGVNSNIAVEVENGKFTMPADAVTVSATFIVNETKQTTKPVPAFSELADDGETVQYLYNVESGAFLLGANDWGTRASLDEAKGYQFKVKKNDDGTTWTLNDYVENQSAWKAVFADNTSGIWVDNLSGANVAAWEIKALGDNTYEITNPAAVADGKLAVSPALNDSRLYLVDDSRFGSTWAFVSEADYAQYLIDYAAWLEYVPELKQSTEAGTDITPAIGRIATSMDGWSIDNESTFHINTWSWEGLTDGSWMTPSFLENWVAAGSLLPEGTWTYTISGLVPGQAYEVSALVRAYNEGSTDIPTGAYLYAGEGKSEDIATGTTNVGTKASVYATLTATGFADEEGNLKIGIVEKDNNFNWIVARDFKVTVSDAIFVPSIELANYAVTTDGEIDEEGFVRATVTYDPTVVGEFTWPTVEFTAEVVDAAGEVVTTVLLNTYADPIDGAITDGAVIGDIPGLEPNTAYTINITKVEVTAFDMEETFDFYTVYEEEGVDAPLATVQFTTPMPTGVAGLDAAEDAVKADGKYLENGKVVIYKGGIKYSATGAVLNK